MAELIAALPDEEAYLELLKRFKKILHKYAQQLNYEDAYEDLQLFFLSLVNSMQDKPVLRKGEGAIVNYIVSSVRHYYIAVSKAHNSLHLSLFSEISEGQLVAIENMKAKIDEPDISEFFPVKYGLSEKEMVVIKELFVEGFSVKEIANRYSISRQAVNQLKLRALKKIGIAMQL